MVNGSWSTLLQVRFWYPSSRSSATDTFKSPKDVEQMATQEKKMPNQRAVPSTTVGPSLN